jgi:hypothetical protein
LLSLLKPGQDIGESEGIVGATKGLVTGVSKGIVGMVTKPLGKSACDGSVRGNALRIV